ncbi:MAG: hutC [Proteobacteria bacterium]|nr:hutC [Pseudomonadota bacterium]
MSDVNERLGGTPPLYAMVKQMILARIGNGEWPARHRIPSENELVATLGLSRMTINRALRELAADGVLLRIQGLGTFVAEGKSQTSVFEVRNIADEIAERGHQHSAQTVMKDEVKATPELADELGVELGTSVFHSLVIHLENDIPVQLEDRHVNPALAPDYLIQDFSARTPNSYLSAVVPWTSAEHTVEAVVPAPWEAKLLSIGRGNPCLYIHRRTFSGDKVVTSVRLLLPGGRSRIESRQTAGT